MELKWCQSKVLGIVESARDPTVKVKWDAQLDAHGYDQETITNQDYCQVGRGKTGRVDGEWMVRWILKVRQTM